VTDAAAPAGPGGPAGGRASRGRNEATTAAPGFSACSRLAAVELERATG